ncbi:MAG: folylpolyglutamate synthase [Trizodia sp. TS-e1964]|nr:MAG: folylpolyglutamate synthase [Trizodia sp. TS-e1964]
MILQGLERIGRLLQGTKLPWRAIHVAGTNGKGSTCAYISAMLHAGGIKAGRFNSPHLIDTWDSIAIDQRPISEALYRQVEQPVHHRNTSESIGASEFELLTATAFEVFAQEKVEIGVVEVGIGGRLDATNILKDPLVTVITSIGLDHQPLLGSTLEEIALQKAGIMKPGVPCVVSSTIPESALDVISHHAASLSQPVPIYLEPSPGPSAFDIYPDLRLEKHQRGNMSCAYRALQLALDQTHPNIDTKSLLPALYSAKWPGRLQQISIEALTGRTQQILLDGAHNAQSASALASYVDSHLRGGEQEVVTWVIAMSQGKQFSAILTAILRPQDNVVAVEFGPVVGMPWIKPATSNSIIQTVQESGHHRGQIHDARRSLTDALQSAVRIAAGGPLVVAGSLYLVSDVLRSLRKHGS